jgi:hypothetical protein
MLRAGIKKRNKIGLNSKNGLKSPSSLFSKLKGELKIQRVNAIMSR